MGYPLVTRKKWGKITVKKLPHCFYGLLYTCVKTRWDTLYIRDCPKFFDQVGYQTINPSIGNIGFPNEPFFRYGNFFISRVEKSSKISPRAKNLALPRAVGPRKVMFFSKGLSFEEFSTRGMKKFSYLKITAHSEIIFL